MLSYKGLHFNYRSSLAHLTPYNPSFVNASDGRVSIYLDQHSHTTYSDGKMSPSQLVEWHIASGYTAAFVCVLRVSLPPPSQLQCMLCVCVMRVSLPPANACGVSTPPAMRADACGGSTSLPPCRTDHNTVAGGLLAMAAAEQRAADAAAAAVAAGLPIPPPELIVFPGMEYSCCR